jgi:hypothetical protein
MPPIGPPHCAAASRPPCRDLQAAPHRRGASRRYAGPSPLARLGGWPPPLRPQPRRWRGVARPAPGAGQSSPRRHPDSLRGRDPRLGSGWNSLAGARSPPPRPDSSRSGLGDHAGLCPPSAGKAARVRSGGGPPAFLPRRRTCRKVPRPETGRPRHARIAVAAGSPPRQ